LGGSGGLKRIFLIRANPLDPPNPRSKIVTEKKFWVLERTG